MGSHRHQKPRTLAGRRTTLFCAALLLLAGSARAELLDGVAAVVGDEVILRSELDAATLPVVTQIREQRGGLTPAELRELRREALESLIDDKLVMQVAERSNMVASDPEIDQAVEGIAAEEGVDVELIYAAAAQQGLERDTYREQLGQQITRMKIISGSVQQRVNVSDAEVQEVFEKRYTNARAGMRIRALHILIPIPPDATLEQRGLLAERVDTLRNKALDSGNFPGLARTYSAAPTAEKGGLTVFVEDEAPRQIIEALNGLSPGEITPVVETPFGLNLFQYLDRFDPGDVKLSEVEAKLRMELTERKTMPELRKWIDELRETRYIEVVHPDLK